MTLDVEGPSRRRVVTPYLDQLALVYSSMAGAGSLSRVDGIKRLLKDGLRSYAVTYSSQHATLIQRLFFDSEGEPTRSPGDRRAAVRMHTGLDDRTLRARREGAFREFAAFLATFPSQTSPSGTAPPGSAAQPTLRAPTRRRMLVGLGVVLALGVALLVGRWVSGSTALVPPTVPTSVPSGGTTPVGGVALTFDALGGGSSIVQVYPGVQNTPADKLENGTFRNGQTVRAVCQTIGRTITSDPSVGEHREQSNRWVRIVSAPEVTQYASLTYADITPGDLASFPECPRPG